MVTTASSIPSGMGAGQRAPRRSQLAKAAIVLFSMVGCGELTVDGEFANEEAVTQTRSALTATADQSLVITAPWVTRNGDRTGDPCTSVAGDENTKEWSFGHMMKEEAANRGVTASAFVTSFMDAWTTTANINGQTVPTSWGPILRDSWNFFAGNTTLPLHKAPFKLIAIVNRIDLRKHRAFGEPLGGELRFVFGFLGGAQCPTGTAEAEASMIVEYSPNKGNENEVKDYATRWLALSTMAVGTTAERDAYRNALQNLTEEVILNGKLLRIRTNELRGTPAGKTWDLTELEPNPSTGLFRRVTVKQSPTMALINGSQAMSDWIWANRGTLFANAFDQEWGRGGRAATVPPIASYSVPNTFPGTSTFFRGGFNMIGADPAAVPPAPPRSFPGFFGGPNPTGLPAGSEGAWSEARFRFSVGTCTGCHSSETGTAILHISPTSSGAQRSPWLSGTVTVTDPVTGSTRSFDEMARRETDLRKLVNGAAVTDPVFGNNYTVRFKTSNKCLDSAGNTTNDGDLSQLWACHGNGNQRLTLVEVGAGSGVYNLKYKHSGKCIDVQNASTSSGARVEQRACSSNRNSQKLTLSTVAGALPYPRLLKFQHSNLCLLVQNNGTTDGTAIVQGTCPTTDQTKAFDLVE